jgi:hypothetical protein
MVTALDNEAKEAILACGEDPALWQSFLQRADGDLLFWAAKLMEALRDLVRCDRTLSRCADLEAARRTGYQGMADAISVAHVLGCFRIVQHEAAITSREANLVGIERAKANRQRRTVPRNVQLAQEFLRRRSISGNLSDTRLKERIGKDLYGLGKTASVDAIDDGLKKLSGNVFKPDK